MGSNPTPDRLFFSFFVTHWDLFPPLRRASVLEKLDKLDESLEDYQKILTLDPNNTEARFASARLAEMVQQRNEKLKEEMLDKLKDVGNLILKPFGLSTNNFKMVKDEKSGSYSINFVNSNH